MSVKSGILH